MASGLPFPPPIDPQEQSPLSWGEAIEFGELEVTVALVVVVVFIIIVLFGPLDSVLRLVGWRPPFPLLLLPNTLLLAVPLLTSLTSIILLFGAAMLPQASAEPCWEATPNLELIPWTCEGRWPWEPGVEFCGQAPWLAFGFKVFGFIPPLMQGVFPLVVITLLPDWVPHTLLMGLLLWLPMLLLPVVLDPATEKWEGPVIFPLFDPLTVPIPPLSMWRLLPLPSSFTATPIITAEVTIEEEGEEAVEDTEEEALVDIIAVVTAARCFSEPFKELDSASMHSDANSGSDPEPQPEEEEDEEQENEDGGQTAEVAEVLMDLSVLSSTRTLPQLLLPSPLQGEPVDQGEGSY